MGISVTGDVRKLFNLDKQIIFAAAKSLTLIARESQVNVIEQIQKTFVVRGTWYLPSNRLGVRVKNATKTNLSAQVFCSADFLAGQEAGITKTGSAGGKVGDSKAPSGLVAQAVIGGARPNLSAKIPRRLKPRQLQQKAFAIKTRKGWGIYYRKGRGRKRGLQLLYWLDPSVKVKKRAVFVPTVITSVQKRFSEIFAQTLADAVKTAKVD